LKDSLLTALGLVLIIEGLLPLLMPQAWRDTFQRLIVLKDGQLRFVGLISVLGGFFTDDVQSLA
jgi:hypothetical protein